MVVSVMTMVMLMVVREVVHSQLLLLSPPLALPPPARTRQAKQALSGVMPSPLITPTPYTTTATTTTTTTTTAARLPQ
jgi:hypothetical protein